MTHPPHRLASCALLLALSAFGQDPPKPATKPHQGASLVIRTSDRKVAENLAHGLGPVEGEIPEGKEGTCWEISLDDAGKVKVATGNGPVGYMEIFARPGQLLEVFADQTEEALAGMRAVLVLAFTAQGIKAKDAAKLAQGFVDFPKQIASVEIKLSGDPDRVRKQGLDVEVAVVPVARSAFADFVAALQPNGRGAPRIGDEGMMSMSLSIEPGQFGKLSHPLFGIAAALNGKTGEDAKKLIADMKRATGWIDGSMAIGWGDAGMSIVAGLTDPKAYAEFMESDAGKAMMRSGNAQFDVDVQSKALEHHGVSVTKSTLKPKENVDLSQNPVLGKGPVETYMAIAGDWLVMTMLDTKDWRIKDLIDRAVDQKISRAALPGDAMISMKVDIAQFAEKFAGQKLPPDAPHHMTLTIKKAGGGLGLAMHLK